MNCYQVSKMKVNLLFSSLIEFSFPTIIIGDPSRIAKARVVKVRINAHLYLSRKKKKGYKEMEYELNNSNSTYFKRITKEN